MAQPRVIPTMYPTFEKFSVVLIPGPANISIIRVIRPQIFKKTADYMPLGVKKNMCVSSDPTDPSFFAATLKFLLPLRTKCHKIKVISGSDLLFYHL